MVQETLRTFSNSGTSKETLGSLNFLKPLGRLETHRILRSLLEPENLHRLLGPSGHLPLETLRSSGPLETSGPLEPQDL